MKKPSIPAIIIALFSLISCSNESSSLRPSVTIEKTSISEIGKYDYVNMNLITGQGQEIFKAIEQINSQLPDKKVMPSYRKIEYIIEKHISIEGIPSAQQYYLISDGYQKILKKSAQQDDAPEPATNAISASQPSIPPAR